MGRDVFHVKVVSEMRSELIQVNFYFPLQLVGYGWCAIKLLHFKWSWC